MIEGGALQPLGGDRGHGGHKGYCLAAMVDILSCVLSGANWGPFAPPFALRQEIPSGASAAGSATSSGRCGSTASSIPMSSSARSTNGSALSARRNQRLAHRALLFPATRNAGPKTSGV